MVSKELLQELHKLIKEGYGIDLNKREIYETGNTLVEFFKLLSQIQANDRDSKTDLMKVGLREKNTSKQLGKKVECRKKEMG